MVELAGGSGNVQHSVDASLTAHQGYPRIEVGSVEAKEATTQPLPPPTCRGCGAGCEMQCDLSTGPSRLA